MREFSDVFLDAYVAAEGPDILGSVGIYRLEGRGVQLFERIEGDNFASSACRSWSFWGFCEMRA